MRLNSDFRDFIKLLNTHSVKYILIGAFVRAFYGRPRYTGYLDVFIEATPDNATKMIKVLTDFGLGDIGLSIDDFTISDQTVQLGNEPRRIDILTGITGVTFEEAWSKKEKSVIDGLDVIILNKADYIKNKRALGRHKDLADIEEIM